MATKTPPHAAASITPPPAAAAPAPLGDEARRLIRMSDLELRIDDLVNMADIAAFFIEKGFSETSAERAAFTGNPEFYFFTRDQVQRMMFSAYQTKRMCDEFQEAFYQALGEEVG